MSHEDPLQAAITRLDEVLVVERATPERASAAASVEEDGARLRRLREATAQLNVVRNDAGAVLEALLDAAIELTRARRGVVFLEAEDGGLDLALARDAHRRVLEAPKDLPRGVIDRVVREEEGVWYRSLAEAGLAGGELPSLAALCVPLSERPQAEDGAPAERRRFGGGGADALVGCVYVDAEPPRFDEVDLDALQVLANHAATALLKDRSFRAAATDPDTKLFHRARFEVALAEAQRRFEATRAPFSVLLIDMDRFKELNERRGRVLGDALLREFARVLQETVRQVDLCFRYGSDLFAVLLPDTDAAGAEVAGEKLRAAVEGHTFSDGSRLTVSVGGAACPAHADGGEVVRKADQALFQAKHQGRNRLMLWSPELGPAAPRADRLAGILTGHLARDYAHVALLVETFDALSTTHEVQQVLTLAVDKAIEASEAERGAIMLTDDRGELATIVARGRHKTPLELKERFSRSVPEQVLRTGEAVFMVTTDAVDPGTQSVRELGLRTLLCAPLVADSGRIGCLYVDARKGDQEIRSGAMPFFTALARHIALAVENARLRARLRLEGA